MDAALREVDSDIADAVERELGRQRDTLELIASENFAPLAVLQAQVRRGLPRPAATTAAANTWTSWRASPSSEPNGCSVRSTPTCSRTPVPRRALHRRRALLLVLGEARPLAHVVAVSDETAGRSRYTSCDLHQAHFSPLIQLCAMRRLAVQPISPTSFRSEKDDS